MRLRALIPLWVTLCVVFALSHSALAQTGATDRASAQALFDEGKRLLQDGQPAAACPKLEESLKLDPAIGTRYQLAKCYEMTSRSASAWTLYLEVAAKARAAGQTEREEFARAEAARLEPSLSYLTILVPPQARAQGLKVHRNGVVLGRGSWNVRLPVDPGRYAIIAAAPGKKQWRGTIDVRGPKGDESIAVPELAAAPEPPSEPKSPKGTSHGAAGGEKDAAHDNKLTTKHWVGIGLAGAGVISLGVSGVFALRAKGLDDQSGCDGSNCATADALRDNEAARSAGDVATITSIVGGVLIAGGAAVFLAPIADRQETSVVPVLGPRVAGLQVKRSF